MPRHFPDGFSRYPFRAQPPPCQREVKKATECPQVEREAEEARERLREALAEASAARHDAARHRAAAGAAEQERRATSAERDRLAAEASRLEGEVQCLTRRLDEATTSLQEQVGVDDNRKQCCAPLISIYLLSVWLYHIRISHCRKVV